MTNPQTEARAIVFTMFADERLSASYEIETLANVIVEHITTALAAKDAELAARRKAAEHLLERAQTAEAQLAEANKALEEIADAKTELTDRHDYSRGWNDALFRVRQIARRILASLEPAAPEGRQEAVTLHPLEAYADSYAQMSRIGDGNVDCRSVEIDIRQNMIPVTRPAEQAVTDAMVERARTAFGEAFSAEAPEGETVGEFRTRIMRAVLEAALRRDAS